MIRATLDANVIASGVIGMERSDSPPGLILQAWSDERFELVASKHLVIEAERTLKKPFFRERSNPDLVQETLTGLRGVVASTTVAVSGIASHPEDDLVLATAVSAAVDYLVTGDRQLLRLGAYEGVKIVSPRDFLDILGIQIEDST